MKIWCNNIDCKYNQKVKKLTYFSFNKINYVPFEDNNVLGKCTREGYDLVATDTGTSKVNYKFAICQPLAAEAMICDREDCMHNYNRLCSKKEIWINKSPAFPDMIFWHCRCFSDKRISGHRDWSQLLNPDRTAKGFKVTDSEAERYHKEDMKFKSFKIGHREPKEKKGFNR